LKLIKQFKESIDCQKENQEITGLLVDKLGLVIEQSHTLPKKQVKKIYEMLMKTILLRNRLDKIQSKISRQLLVKQNEGNVEQHE